MRITKRLVAGAAATVIACALAPGLAQAQDVTGGISGKITDDAGKPLAHVPVTIVYEPTNTPISTTTGNDGFFSLRGLQVGGPYRVTADDHVHQTKSVEVPGIALGAPYELNFSLDTVGATAVQAVTVRASRVKGSIITQTGPRSTFTPTQIQELPSFSRDLKDVARLNPFVTIDPTNSDAIIIAGNNNHVNTIYLDGVRQSDNFGLNNNGYPTQRSPFSIDIVKAFNVEVAPYDVQYGDFQGGLLNIVTKSGSNDFHGSGFFEYDSNELGAGHVIGREALHQPACTNGNQTGTNAGGVACGDRIFKPVFKDKNYGGYLSGPIIPDKLFFFIDYEKYQTTKISGYGPSDSGQPNGVKGITTANVDQVTTILQNNYGYNAGTSGAILPIQNQDYFARLDANITDKQHLFVTYQRTDGTSLSTPNENVNSILGLSSNFYIYEQLLETYTADLQSHWTPKLSTELEYTHQNVASPSTLLGKPFAEIQVEVPSTSNPTTGSYIYAGPDISRQANNLNVADEQIKAKANYTLGNHVITGGYERDMVTSSDLFVQYATGLYVFSNACGANNVITNLTNHQACSFTYQNAYDNNPATAGSSVENNTDTAYLQDEWHPLSNLTLKGGLRFEYYSTGDKPLFNQTFMNEYGFANNRTIDGENVLMPRVGFNWKPMDGLTVYGGAGLFSGGNPIVYLYDSYDNPGNLLGIVSANCGSTTKPVVGYTGCSATNTGLLTNVNGAAIPAAAQTAVTNNANAGLGNTNSLAPGFQPFQEWKASLGAIKTFDLGQWHLGDHWRVHADYLYQKTRYAPLWQDLFEEANVLPTPAPDGRPVFNPNRFTAARTTGYDIVLTDTDKGYGHVAAVGLGKSWDFGLDVDYSFTYEDIKDVSPATSSVALSNYSQNAVADPNHPALATSSYETKWENKLTVTYDHKFFGDWSTKFSLFMQYRAGNPFSYTFYSSANSSTAADNLFGQTGAAAYRSDQLLYIPKTDASGNVTLTSDPIVTYGSSLNSAAGVAALNTYLHQTGLIKYAGSIAPRNGFTAGAVTTADLRIEQELPAFLPNKYAKLIGYFDLINVPNFINKNWGVIYQTNFPGFISPVQAQNCQLKGNSCVKGTGNFYEYDLLRSPLPTPTVQTPFQPPSATWAIRLGVRYQF